MTLSQVGHSVQEVPTVFSHTSEWCVLLDCPLLSWKSIFLLSWKGNERAFLCCREQALKFEKAYHSRQQAIVASSSSPSSASTRDRSSHFQDTPARWVHGHWFDSHVRELVCSHVHVNNFNACLDSLDEIEERFWSIIDTHGSDGGRFAVEYGNDLDTATVGTGFPAHRMFRATQQRQRSGGTGLHCEGSPEELRLAESLTALPTPLKVSTKIALDPTSSPWNLSNLPFVPGAKIPLECPEFEFMWPCHVQTRCMPTLTLRCFPCNMP